MGSQLEATATNMSDCMEGSAAVGHAGWPGTPPQPGSKHQGWDYSPATVLAFSWGKAQGFGQGEGAF